MPPKKRKQSRALPPAKPPTLEGSPLVAHLRRWRDLGPSSTFRAKLSPAWELPTHLASVQKAPLTWGDLPTFLDNLRLHFTHPSTLLAGQAASAAQVGESRPEAPGRVPFEPTSAQLGAGLIRLAWTTGDRATLAIFLALVEQVRLVVHGATRAAGRKLATPLIGQTATLEDYAAGKVVAPSGWLRGTIAVWAHGERETAREWSRELSQAMVEAEGLADVSTPADEGRFEAACCQEIAMAGYAFALGLLMLERWACELAVFRILRTTVGLVAGRQQDEALAAQVFEVVDRPIRRGLARTWEAALLIDAAGAPSAVYTGLDGEVWKAASPFPEWVAYANAGARSEREARVARMRGFLPAQHKEIPRAAFDPKMTDLEREEP